MTPCGFPHSDIRGSLIICISPRLFAAYHVFLRLPVPRHSPCALLSLTVLARFSFTNLKFSRNCRFNLNSLLRSLCLCSVFKVQSLVKPSFSIPSGTFKEVVGSSGLEPPTSRLSGARSNHLSYEPILVEIRRFELLTPCLQSRCSPS